METLPVDVIPDIVRHLSVKDLAACCAVSPWWRDVFGSDEVWKPRCDPDTEEYLRTTPCRVEPKFATPEAEDTTLSPIGQWRTAYMREVHLRRNWISGNCLEENFNIPYKYDLALMFLNNDAIIHPGPNSFELRDTTGNPSVCLAQFQTPIEDPFYKIKLVWGDTIIAYYRPSGDNNIIQAIKVNTETYTFSEKYRFSSEAYLPGLVLVDNVLLANDDNCMYIWDFETGTNLKTEPSLLRSGCLASIHSYENCDDVIVTALDGSNLYHYFIYSVKELRYLEFTPDLKSPFGELCCAIVNNLFAFFPYEGGLDVYNYQTSCLLYHMELPSYQYQPIRILGESLIFTTIKEELMQLSLSKRALECLDLGISKVRMIDYVEYMDRKLLVLDGKDTVKVMWMVGSEPMIITSKIKCMAALSVNKTFSKILLCHPSSDCVDEVVNCVHLW